MHRSPSSPSSSPSCLVHTFRLIASARPSMLSEPCYSLSRLQMKLKQGVTWQSSMAPSAELTQVFHSPIHTLPTSLKALHSSTLIISSVLTNPIIVRAFLCDSHVLFSSSPEVREAEVDIPAAQVLLVESIFGALGLALTLEEDKSVASGTALVHVDSDVALSHSEVLKEVADLSRCG